MLPRRLAINVPEDSAHLKMVRHSVRQMLDSVDITQQDRNDVELLVGELASNAALHANSGLDYHVEVELRDDTVVVVVTDQGRGFTRDKMSLPGTTRIDKRKEGNMERTGGWGLPMIELLADRVEYVANEPHGTTARAEKRLRKDRALTDKSLC